MGLRVVVGVDGSHESVAALALAVKEARWRGASLQVVAAYAYPHAMLVVPFAPDPPTPEDVQRDAEAAIELALAEVRAHGDDLAGLEIERVTVGGPAAAALMAAADGADLLVVGARGLGGFKGLLLGSVSQQCVQHAPCPVLVARRVATAPPG